MDIEIISGELKLKGEFSIPEKLHGLVIFVHGSGSSRHSSRNKKVAEHLNRVGLGTLLFDLLTVEEEVNRSNVFDIDLLSNRLVEVTSWVVSHPEFKGVKIGFFGASTGAAAALVASTLVKNVVSAVVSRGGRVDLAGECLEQVEAPTLLIVGGQDHEVLELNKAAKIHLRCTNELVVIPGATHLFEEPGTLDLVSEDAAQWFLKYLR